MDDSVKRQAPQQISTGGIESGNRWVSEEWRSFELYEKIRVRTRKSKLFFITAAITLFLVLCAVPVVQERSPKWNTLKIARNLSVEIEKIKTIAIKSKKPVRLTFIEPNLLQIDSVQHCTEGKSDEKGDPLFTKQWAATEGDYRVMSGTEAHEFSIALVQDQFCFDPVDGLVSKFNKQVIAIIPVKDLAEKRLDRASYVIIEGESAKVSIN